MIDYDESGEDASERAYDRTMAAAGEAAADATDPLPDPDGVDIRFGCDQDAEGEVKRERDMLRKALSDALLSMRHWAAQEDGIPEDGGAWDAYMNGACLLGWCIDPSLSDHATAATQSTQQSAPVPCQTCGGSCGHWESIFGTDYWVGCPTCHGTGVK